MKLGIIGVGNMASAILTGILSQKLFEPEDILLFDPHADKTFAFQEKGLVVTKTTEELVDCADLVLLSVKPQQIDSVLSTISGHTQGKCIISIAAGISTAYIQSRLTDKTDIVRVMPNTPILMGYGATVIAQNNGIASHLFERAVSLFSCSGEVAFVEESLIDAATGVNGSSPAYFFTMAEAMVNTAVEQGIDAETALRLAAKAMEGAAVMLQRTGKSPSELTAQVTSPGGTTLAALAEMQRMGFSDAIRSGMLACTKRAHELGK